jgi:hypothetical protein
LEDDDMKALRVVLVLWLMAGGGSLAFAQGVQTGVITGTVTDADGLVVPGATVTVSSPALQGTRTAVSDSNGVYAVRGLPPGQYTVRFELAGMRPIEATQRVDLGLTARVDAQMQLDTLAETVTVTAQLPSMVTSVSTGANYRAEMVDKLATPRTVQGVAELAPGLTDNTPNAGQVTIAAASPTTTSSWWTAWTWPTTCSARPTTCSSRTPSKRSGALLGHLGRVRPLRRRRGERRHQERRQPLLGQLPRQRLQAVVDDPDALRGIAQPERTGDTAEHLRVDGGRSHPARPHLVLPLRPPPGSTLTPQPFQQTGIANSNSAENTRLEFKGTATAFQNHTFQGTYLTNNTLQVQPSFGFSLIPRPSSTATLPNDLIVGSWRGVLSDKIFATAQVRAAVQLRATAAAPAPTSSTRRS